MLVGMRRTMISLVTLVTVLLGLTAPNPASAAPAPVGREHLLTLTDYSTVYPDMDDPIRVVLRSPLFAPRGCEDQGAVVRGSSRILGSVSPELDGRADVALIGQNVVRFASKAHARALVQRYRFFTKRCVGDVHTDDGEGGKVLLKNRAWIPPRVGDESSGMLIGWVQGGSTDWRRVVAVRVGRTVSVIDVSVIGQRPRRTDVVALGELAAERLR
ncbi:exported hypothetical protein [metagenome]|uniref:PknH-like extracellular domain-containing protein n=1 Tax=metagenome TaxID=256318 RepID=A0A2P2C2D0_9ZZZZ